MRITGCHIDGFGKINNEDFKFDKGLNIIKEENGFGKSTIATFIKVMLYGFDEETKKSLSDKEREKYRPWNKGIYGGRLSFEINGKEYEVTRIFGKKESDDSFEVRDVNTNNLVDIFSKSELGNQVFGIDKNSFFRTAYIAAHDLNLREEKVYDSIRAKLGNLTDATDDINNYENVCEKITKKLNEYSPDRKPGKIKNLKIEIQNMENDCRKLDDLERAIEINENQMVRLNDKIAMDKEKLEALSREKNETIRVEMLKKQKETYNSYLGELEESVKKAREIENGFSGKLPSSEELTKAKSDYFESRQLIKQMNENHFYRDDSWDEKCHMFSEGTPGEEEIKEYINLADTEKDKKRDILSLSAKLDRAVEDYINQKLAAVREENETIQKDADKKNASNKGKRVVTLIISMILFVTGAGLLFLSGFTKMPLLISGAVCLALGLALLVIAFAILGKQVMPELKEEIIPDKSEALNNSPQVKEIEKEIKDAENEITLIDGQIERFLNKFGYDYDRDNVVNILLELMKVSGEYREGIQKINRYNELSKECEQKENDYEAFIQKTGIDKDSDILVAFEEIQNLLARYEEINEEIKRKRANLDKYEADNDIGELLKELPENIRSQEDIEDEAEDVTDELEEDKENLSRQSRMIEGLEEEKSELLTLKNQKEAAEELLTSYERNYNLMKFTLEYLTKAKDGLSNKYTGPTMEAFGKYCSKFFEKTDDYKMDTNFEMTKVEEGLQRRIRELSSGQKDIIDLCMRMALVKAMYKDENPFVIMDDPFINLDDSNLKAGMELIKEAGSEYQIIYFTCHDSRGGC